MQTAFSYTVNYAKYSANMSAMHPDACRLFVSADEAREFGDKEAERLQFHGTIVRNVEVERFCVKCNGIGHHIVKTGKRVIRTKQVTCPDCQGYGSETVMTVLY